MIGITKLAYDPGSQNLTAGRLIENVLSLPKATLEKLGGAFSVPIRAVPVSAREETDEDLANNPEDGVSEEKPMTANASNTKSLSSYKTGSRAEGCTMELRHFRYFIAVAEESSLGRATHRLHVSQPAVSQQINDLEDMLGLKLLTRNSRGVELTEAGRAFLIGGRRVLVAAKEAAERALEAAHGESGRLVIGRLGASTISFLAPALSRFREQHPIGSCPSTRTLLLGTSNGCVGFANGSAILNQR